MADIELAEDIAVSHYVSPVVRELIVKIADLRKKPDVHSTLGSQLLAGERFALLDCPDDWAWGYGLHDRYVGYIRADALGACDENRAKPVISDDPLKIALTFLNVPYLWGGRSRQGIDCSGLMQLTLAAGGIAAPRDSDLQQAAVGSEISSGTALRRGDIVFFPDHVGMMVNDRELVHATRHWGKVIIEPLNDVVARIAENHEQPVLAKKRLTP